MYFIVYNYKGWARLNNQNYKFLIKEDGTKTFIS